MTRRLIGTVFLALVLAACGGSGETGPENLDGSADGDWVLESGTLDGAGIPIVDGFRVTLTIAGTEMGGTAACNGYGGTIEQDDSSFSVGDFFVTEMACEPRVMASESAFLQALARVELYERSTNELVLRGTGVELAFVSLPPIPTANLVDTPWLLESLVDEQAVSSTMGGATLELRSDGTLTGSTGCRELTGTWTTAGDTIQFTEFAALGECDPTLASQDEHVITVLGDGFTAVVEGDRLSVRSAGLLGLDYRAAG